MGNTYIHLHGTGGLTEASEWLRKNKWPVDREIITFFIIDDLGHRRYTLLASRIEKPLWWEDARNSGKLFTNAYMTRYASAIGWTAEIDGKFYFFSKY